MALENTVPSYKPQHNKDSKKKFTMPHIYVILFIFSAIAAIATYFVPAGVYERIPGPEGRTTIDPESYQVVEQTPIGLIDFMLAIPTGLVDAGVVVFFTFIIGGMFMVLRKTGIIEIGVDKLTRKFSNKSITLVPVLMIVFAAICSLIGTQELSLVYVPVILPLMIALRFDSVVAAAVALTATTAGFTTGVLNPINTGLGQKIAEIPVYSGIGLRAVAFVAVLTIGIVYVLRYAKKVQNNPELSLVFDEDREKRELYQNTKQTSGRKMTNKQLYASIATLGFFAVLVYGVLNQGWFMLEMSGLFIIMGIVVGLIAGLKPTEICEGFNEGFRDVLVGAMIVGVSRAVAVVMEEGQIMDTIIHGLGNVVGDFPSILSAIGMFMVQLLFNFLVPSGSGQALVTMPIMAPLSDLIGITRQTAVLAYQLGDGIGNILFPTSGYFMATLALAGVGWQKWVRFYLPLFFMWVAVAIVLLIFAQAVQWVG
ncbi:YfcC family protein [Aquibacillus albus]|uniref:Ion transporter superfamily protein YfcC n=1 Tax=Aquibacillus albus TaxID=1168171 RepID=A0ABS2MWE3_9BACI|nr:TIGR00366 family protein [Aquibacillus albus]MBM7570179.1 putative ion transporter superfamily protein YfcC [Aquibacillus albus]